MKVRSYIHVQRCVKVLHHYNTHRKVLTEKEGVIYTTNMYQDSQNNQVSTVYSFSCGMWHCSNTLSSKLVTL